MKLCWDVDDQNRVEVTYGGLGKNFGKLVVSLNGREVHRASAMGRKPPVAFTLGDGRAATVIVTPVTFSVPTIELRVEGQLMVPMTSEPIKCASCGASAKHNDRFCDGCGKPLPPPESYEHRKRVREATSGMRWLAVLFLVFGPILYFSTQSKDAEALKLLDGRDATSTLVVSGVTYTVAELRRQLIWEPWGALVTNVILAAVMGGLAVWGKRAPLPAVLVGAATYATVIVANAISDPTSLGQGIYMKIAVVSIFFRGIRAALALRAAEAAAA